MRPNTSAIALQLLRAVVATAGCDPSDREKPIIVTELLETRDWASATFEGEVHRLHLRIDGEASAVAAMLDRLRHGLPDRDIALNGWFVADILVEDRQDDGDHDDSLGNSLAIVNQNVTSLSQSLIIRALVLRD